jgi:hypothetical protein
VASTNTTRYRKAMQMMKEGLSDELITKFTGLNQNVLESIHDSMKTTHSAKENHNE